MHPDADGCRVVRPWHDRIRRGVSRKTALAALAMRAAFVVIWQLTRDLRSFPGIEGLAIVRW